MVCTDWRRPGGSASRGNIGESGKATLAQMIVPAGRFPRQQQALLARVIVRLDYGRRLCAPSRRDTPKPAQGGARRVKRAVRNPGLEARPEGTPLSQPRVEDGE